MAEQLPASNELPIFRLVKVVNCNSFAVSDMYDGVPYEFKPNTPLSIPIEAAQHFFLWPEVEPEIVHRWIARRHGWNTMKDIEPQDDGRMRWQHWAENIKIAPIQFDLVPRDPDAPIPADFGEPEGEPDAPPMADPHDVDQTKVGTRKGIVRPARRVDV